MTIGDDTPLQAALRSTLVSAGSPAPHDPQEKAALLDLIADLVGAERLAWLRERAGGERLKVSRFELSSIQACEANFLEEVGTPFSYNISRAKTRIANRAIRRWYFRRPMGRKPQTQPDTIDAIHELLDDFGSDDPTLAGFISSLGEGERAELASEVLNIVDAFIESWPSEVFPGVPRSGQSIKALVLDGTVQVTAPYGFRFGKPVRGSEGWERGVALIDIRPSSGLDDPARFDRRLLALLDLLSSLVAPALVVTWYAETMELRADPVTPELLEAAARYLAGGIGRIVDLSAKRRAPARLAQWRCGTCALKPDCPEGRAWDGNGRPD